MQLDETLVCFAAATALHISNRLIHRLGGAVVHCPSKVKLDSIEWVMFDQQCRLIDVWNDCGIDCEDEEFRFADLCLAAISTCISDEDVREDLPRMVRDMSERQLAAGRADGELMSEEDTTAFLLSKCR